MYVFWYCITEMTKEKIILFVPPLSVIFQVALMLEVLVISKGFKSVKILEFPVASSFLVASSHHWYTGLMCSLCISVFSFPIKNKRGQKMLRVCGEILLCVIGSFAARFLTLIPVTTYWILFVTLASSVFLKLLEVHWCRGSDKSFWTHQILRLHQLWCLKNFEQNYFICVRRKERPIIHWICDGYEERSAP